MPGNIALIGFMGSGKSTVGPILAADLGWSFVDTDNLIEKKTGLSIKEIFACYGETHFRELERKAVAEAVSGKRAVIATGGGAVLSLENMQRLKEGNKVVWLQVQPDTVLQRTGTAEDRPLLQGQKGENIVNLLEQREKYYTCADVWLTVDAMKPAEVAAAIKGALQRWLACLA